jgi:hypothetical protein
VSVSESTHHASSLILEFMPWRVCIFLKSKSITYSRRVFILTYFKDSQEFYVEVDLDHKSSSSKGFRKKSKAKDASKNSHIVKSENISAFKSCATK